MVEDSESDSDIKSEINSSTLREQLSAQAFEALQRHLQQTTPTEEDPRSTPDTAEQSPRDGRTPASSSSNLVYKVKEYWDSRFTEESDYDWLANYVELAEHLRQAIPKDARVLVVGCGNSSLSADMYDDGYRNMLSTDFSEVVIEKMRTRHQVRRPGLRWEKMDMLALDLEDGSVDAVVDKAAMDALMVDKGDPWNPSQETIDQSHQMCSEVSRVLVPGGIFVQLSFEQEHFRKKLLLGQHLPSSTAGDDDRVAVSMEGKEDSQVDGGVVLSEKKSIGLGSGDGFEGRIYGWDLTTHDVRREAGSFGHFLYMMKKRGGGATSEE